MDQSSVILFSIIIVVLLGVPVVISKKLGVKPMEMLFGKLANRGIFKSDKGEGQSARPRERQQTNSSRNDLMDLISRLATYARRNKFRLIVPGTLSCGGSIAVLTALVLTRSGVVGINCFGFGGRIDAARGDEDWTQVMNGRQTAFASPVKKNRNQEKLVRQALEEAGFRDAAVEIVGVFTASSAWLTNAAGTNCYTTQDALKYLRGEAFTRDGGLEPKALEAALMPRIVRAAPGEAGKNTDTDKGEKP